MDQVGAEMKRKKNKSQVEHKDPQELSRHVVQRNHKDWLNRDGIRSNLSEYKTC
jgi:hypothetical protein